MRPSRRRTARGSDRPTPEGRDGARASLRRVVHEEGAVGRERRRLPHPRDGPIGHVLGEVVAVVRGAVRLDRGRAVVQRRRVLVRLAAEEPVEVLEAAAARRPRIERPGRARLPHGHLMALAELRRGEAVEAQHLRERRRRLRTHGGVAGRGRGDLGDRTHPHGVVVAAGQERLPGGRAQGRRVEARERQAVARKSFGRRRLARAAEHAGGTEPDVVEKDDQDVRCTLRGPDRRDRLEDGSRVLRVVVDRPGIHRVRNRQDCSLHLRSVSLVRVSRRGARLPGPPARRFNHAEHEAHPDSLARPATGKWWGGSGSNRRRPDYESGALTS